MRMRGNWPRMMNRRESHRPLGRRATGQVDRAKEVRVAAVALERGTRWMALNYWPRVMESLVTLHRREVGQRVECKEVVSTEVVAMDRGVRMNPGKERIAPPSRREW